MLGLTEISLLGGITFYHLGSVTNWNKFLTTAKKWSTVYQSHKAAAPGWPGRRSRRTFDGIKRRGRRSVIVWFIFYHPAQKGALSMSNEQDCPGEKNTSSFTLYYRNYIVLWWFPKDLRVGPTFIILGSGWQQQQRWMNWNVKGSDLVQFVTSSLIMSHAREVIGMG